MMTMNDFIGMVGRKAGNEALKNFIKKTYHPYIAEQKCNVIDAMERTGHFVRFVNEINEWEMRKKTFFERLEVIGYGL